MTIISEIIVQNGENIARIHYDGDGWNTELLTPFCSGDDLREIAKAVDMVDSLISKESTHIGLETLRNENSN